MPVYRLYKTGAPFNASELPRVSFAQVADVIYYAHNNHQPGKLVRYAHTDWEWFTVSFGPTIQPPASITGAATTPNTDSANSGNAYFPEPATYSVTAFDSATGQESRASPGVTLTNDLTLKRNYNTLSWPAATFSSAQGGYYLVYKAVQSGFPGYIGSTDQLTFVDDNIDADTSTGPPTGYNPFPGALASMTSPTNGALSASSGGSLAAATYYVKTTWVSPDGETLPSSETSLAVDASNVLNVASPADAPSGATGWNVYVSAASGSETLQNSSPITIGTAWVEPTGGLVTGVAPPNIDSYPGVVKFHEQRSWWGNTISHPNALYASRSADYENMDFRQPGQADDSLAIALVNDKVNTVNQLASTKQGLLALTTNAIFSITGSNDDYIAATPPPRSTPEVTRGVSTLAPILIDAAVLYQTVKTGEVRSVGYEFEIDGLKTDDVSIFSRHLFDNHTIVDWAWAEKPHSAIFAVRDDGVMLVLTWDQTQQVWGWTECTTDGLYLGVCAITEQGEDRIYVLVERTISGSTVAYVERFASELWTEAADCCYLDCAKTYENTDTSTTLYDRLDHLEGETVYAWVDGALYTTDVNGDPLVVQNGAVTLSAGGLIVTIGLPFTAEIETLPLALQTKAGWSIARPQDAGHVIVKVIDSRNVQAGPSEDSVFEIPAREYEAMGTPTDLFTGNLQVDMDGVVSDEMTVYIKSDVPSPLYVVGIMVEPNFGNIS